MWQPGTMLLLSGMLLGSLQEVWCSSSSPEQVAILTDTNFKPILETGDLWLVEFYAPWCGHCKRLNPLLDELAPILGERMRIGKLDATIYKRTANEHSIQGYPMLKFKRKGQPLQDYDGPRSKEGLMAFADRMNAPAPEVVSSLDELKRLRDENEVVFLLAVPRNGPRPPIESAFASVAEGMKHSHAFAAIQAELLDRDFTRPAPFIAKLETGEAPLYYEGSLTATSPSQLRDWVNGNSLPLLSAYAGHNFRRLGEMGKLMVIAVIDPLGGDKTEAFLNRLREVGRSQRDLMAKHFVLGYLDGIRWDGFVRQFNIEKHELPRFFVLDYTKQTFYEDDEVDEVDEIEQYLADIVAGKVPAQRQGALQAGRRIWQGLKDWYPYSLFLLLPVVLLLSTCLYPSLWVGESPEDENVGKEGTSHVSKAQHAAAQLLQGEAKEGNSEGDDANHEQENAEDVLKRKKDE